MRDRIVVFISMLVFAGNSIAQQQESFAPFEQWKSALVANNAAALRSFYSNQPAARINTTEGKIGADSEVAFWTGLKARSVAVTVMESGAPRPGLAEVMFQASVKTASSKNPVNVLEDQVWQQQNGIWRLVGGKRDITKLEQPKRLDAKIYPEGDARKDVRRALESAAKSHKHVLVVFGADWCYDCHVLDKAFARPDIAGVLHGNYEVVHVDVGEGNKNQDLMNEYQVPMKRGIPAIAVLDSDGKLLYSQKNGEFERARSLGPEDLLEFLGKWKPQAR